MRIFQFIRGSLGEKYFSQSHGYEGIFSQKKDTKESFLKSKMQTAKQR